MIGLSQTKGGILKTGLTFLFWDIFEESAMWFLVIIALLLVIDTFNFLPAKYPLEQDA